MSEDSSTKPAKPKSKGSKFKLITFRDIDGRTRAARAALDLHRNFLSDLGGESNVTTAQRELCQRAACMGAALEDMEAAMLKGDEVSLSDYTTMCNSQRRILADIGLDRRARDVTPPSVEQYLQHRKRETSA